MIDGKFILVGREIKRCDDLDLWASWFETADRQVASTVIGKYRVSTVFLGLDHSFGGGLPLLFETMVFNKKSGEHMDRCTTYAEAEAMHARAVYMITERVAAKKKAMT